MLQVEGMQTRAAVVPLAKGDAVVFAVNSRPVRGTRGDYRVKLRHGVSKIIQGHRHTLGIIFHAAVRSGGKSCPTGVAGAGADGCGVQHVQSGLSNTRVEMGASALVEANGVEILLCSLRNQAMGTDLFTDIGCDLAAKKIVVVKSSQHFHASYSKIAARVIYAAAPGAVTHDLRTLTYRKVRRPKWPLDA